MYSLWHFEFPAQGRLGKGEMTQQIDKQTKVLAKQKGKDVLQCPSGHTPDLSLCVRFILFKHPFGQWFGLWRWHFSLEEVFSEHSLAYFSCPVNVTEKIIRLAYCFIPQALDHLDGVDSSFNWFQVRLQRLHSDPRYPVTAVPATSPHPCTGCMSLNIKRPRADYFKYLDFPPTFKMNISEACILIHL